MGSTRAGVSRTFGAEGLCQKRRAEGSQGSPFALRLPRSLNGTLRCPPWRAHTGGTVDDSPRRDWQDDLGVGDYDGAQRFCNTQHRTGTDRYRQICGIGMCIDMYTDMYMDMCMDLCGGRGIDMSTDKYADICTDMCTDMYQHMRSDMCTCICVDICMAVRKILQRVERRPYTCPCTCQCTCQHTCLFTIY